MQVKGTILAKNRRKYWSLREELFVLYFAVRNPRTPFLAKFATFFAFVYLISPIDLIPDFIPIAGYLDDLIIVPLVLRFAFRLLPAEIIESSWQQARKQMVKLRIIFFLLVLLMTSFLAALFFLIRHILHHM